MADEKLIFPIGFDLEEGVAQVEKDWGKMQKKLQDTFKSQTIQVDADISKAVLDKLYAKFEGLIKTMESKAPQIKLKIPDTVDFEQEINRLKVQLKSINLGELTDAESKDLYLYIRQLEALAKALKEVNKQEQLRQANNPANKALQEARAQEKLTRAKANDALAEQRRAKIATETARQNEINNRSAQRGAVIAEQKRAATARAENAELRLTRAKERSTQATHEQNAAYKTQSSYLSRLVQRMVAYASVTQAFSFIRNIREVTAEFELQRVALGSIIGDLNEANAMFEQIKAAAVKSPFQIKELVTYTKQLAAYKIETDELFETTQKLADVSAGLGVGMERLVLAYGQIRATGYLRASEVRQLTEAGIPIVEELAKKMSDLRGETVSAAEVMGLISERAISFGMVKEVFDDMTSAGGMFYKMQEKQAETLAGQWSNLQDAISIMYEEIGNTESVNNSIKGTIGLVKSLAENWRDVYSVAQSLSVAMGVYYVAVKNAAMASQALTIAEATRLAVENKQMIIIPKWLAFFDRKNRLYKVSIALEKALAYAQLKTATATNVLSKGFWKLTTAMLSNPYTAVLAALAGITLAIVKFTTQAVLADDAIKGINSSLSEFERHATATDDLMEKYNRLAGTTNRTAEEQKVYQETLNELGKMYPDAIEGMDKYGNVLDLNIERLAEASTLQREFNRDLAETQIQLAESLIPKLEEEIEDAKNALGKRFFSYWGNYSKEWKFGLFSGDKDQTELLDMIASMREEIEKLKKSADEAREKLAGITKKGDGKTLSDTFNTWQKELASITEGKNLKGEGIRLFDDESITQINKLTDATARVAEEYDKLAKEKKEVDKVLKSEGAKADKDTYAKLQERLGKINEGMSGLYDFLKKYGALDLIKSDDKTQKSAEQALKDELAAVEKIYKRYQDLRKLKSETDTQSILAKEFKGVSLTTLSKAYSPEQMIAVYQEALAEAQRLGKKDLVLEIQTKIGEFNVAEEQRKLEKSLKDLSDKISRTKTAKEFFDRMLGMTGDKEFSASLTLSVYGEGGEDLGTKLAQQTADAFKAKYKGINFSKTAISDKGVFDWETILMEGEEESFKLGEELYEQFLKDVEAGKKANADWLIDLQKTYEKAFTFEERRTQVMEQEAQKQREIIASTLLSDPDKNKYIEASRNRLNKLLADINFEEFKASADYVKIFEDIDNLATPTIERLLTKLKEQIDAYKELDPEKAKTLMNEYQKLYDGLINRNPFKAIADGIKEYSEALKSGDKDAKRSAITKVQKGFEGVENAFSSAANSVNELAKSLGFAENSDTAVFLQGIAKAFGFVATSITLAKVAMDLFDKETKKFLTTNPFGWVLAIGSAVVGVLSAISNAKVRKADKEIEHQQDLIDSLGKSYEKLEKQIEKTFGSDYLKNYNDRLANLYAQQEAYLKQAEAERSKGKKEDEEKTQGYLDSASDVAEQIADMQAEVSERFLGTDLASTARDFANSWIDAYKEFGSTTDAMKEKFHDMIQNMVVESIAGKMMQELLRPLFEDIEKYAKDGQLDEREIADIADMSIGLIDAMDEGMTGIVERLRAAGYDIRQSTSGLTGISKDIATASEESILGLAAGINTQNFYISQVPPKLDTIIALLQGGGVQVGGGVNMQDLITIQNQHLSHLPNIAQNTAETVAECKQIVAETRRTADALERVIKPRGTQATHTLNATLN